MRVLVTGAAGRIGLHIVRELRAHGYTVRGSVRPDSPRNQRLAREGVEAVTADLHDGAALAAAVDGCDAVVHSGVIFTRDPADMFAGSLAATAALLEAARATAVQRFVFLGSTSVYEGDSYRPDEPIMETEAQPNTTTVYGACKLGAEALCSAYFHAFKLPTVTLRLPMTTAGAELLTRGFLLETWAEDQGAPPAARDAARAAMHDGAVSAIPVNADGTPWVRHFCDVRDAARAVRLALTADAAAGCAVNVAGEPIDYAAAAEAAGKPSARISAGTDYRYRFSLALAAELIGYRPQFSMAEMVADAWQMREGRPVAGLTAP